MSSEMPYLREADTVAKCGRQKPRCRKREAQRVPRGRRPWHVRKRYAREPGYPGFARGQQTRAALGSLRTGANDERTREVGQAHGTGELSERSRDKGGGGGGGKGLGHREPEPAKHVP